MRTPLSDWKTGRSCPKSDKLYVLARYFGVDIEFFLEDKERTVRKREDSDKTKRKIAPVGEVTSNNYKSCRQTGTGNIPRSNDPRMITSIFGN